MENEHYIFCNIFYSIAFVIKRVIEEIFFRRLIIYILDVPKV